MYTVTKNVLSLRTQNDLQMTINSAMYETINNLNFIYVFLTVSGVKGCAINRLGNICANCNVGGGGARGKIRETGSNKYAYF